MLSSAYTEQVTRKMLAECKTRQPMSVNVSGSESSTICEYRRRGWIGGYHE